jgi:hypothetical protein
VKRNQGRLQDGKEARVLEVVVSGYQEPRKVTDGRRLSGPLRNEEVMIRDV